MECMYICTARHVELHAANVVAYEAHDVIIITIMITTIIIIIVVIIIIIIMMMMMMMTITIIIITCCSSVAPVLSCQAGLFLNHLYLVSQPYMTLVQWLLHSQTCVTSC